MNGHATAQRPCGVARRCCPCSTVDRAMRSELRRLRVATPSHRRVRRTSLRRISTCTASGHGSGGGAAGRYRFYRMRVCMCGSTGPFRRSAWSKDGLSSKCKECIRKQDGVYRSQNREQIKRARRARKAEDTARMRVWRKSNPGSTKKYRLLGKYKLSLEDFQRLRQKQDDACALCLEPLDFSKPTGTDSPQIDHDHSCCNSQKTCGLCIRGLVHSRCNAGLANFRDDPDKLMMAVSYLKRSRRP